MADIISPHLTLTNQHILNKIIDPDKNPPNFLSQ